MIFLVGGDQELIGFVNVHHVDNYTDAEIWNRFQFTRESIYYIENLVREDLVRPARRKHHL